MIRMKTEFSSFRFPLQPDRPLRRSHFCGVLPFFSGVESEAVKPLLRRESVETYPPFFLEDFLSGNDIGRDGLNRAQFQLGRDFNYPVLSRNSRTISGRNLVVGSDSISGLIMGDFGDRTTGSDIRGSFYNS
jgi:hypothetical protein